jgi:oxidase EvaA
MQNAQLAFLKSAFQKEGVFVKTPDIIAWLKKQNEIVKVCITRTSFSKLRAWSQINGSLQHETGKFFSIDGIHVQTNWGNIDSWEQPIINQPEIGYLGFITKEFNGVLHFLMQAKIEPGNVNYVQLSPTLQATKSNYTQVHKGKSPAYLEYFKNAKPEQILVDQLQSEQGARFLRKRNRNIIIFLEEELPILDNFIWLTLAQIKELMNTDNLVNMDTRTVISGISYGSLTEDSTVLLDFQDQLRENTVQRKFLDSAIKTHGSHHSLDHIIAFLTSHKSNFDLHVNKVDIKKIQHWIFSDEALKHEENKYFQVIPVEVEISNREVLSWCQPMVQPMQGGLCAFVCKEINGIMHFAVQAKLECGNHDIIEFAPTVQCLTGNYRNTSKGSLPFLDYVLESPKKNVIFDTLQSEEGGRFYKEQNRNMLVLADDSLDIELPENYIWMTLNQMFTFLKFNNFFNIQARSLVAAIQFV